MARTVETVEGGGVVVLLLSSLDSLTRLYSLTMDVHARLRTESHQNVTGGCSPGGQQRPGLPAGRLPLTACSCWEGRAKRGGWVEAGRNAGKGGSVDACRRPVGCGVPTRARRPMLQGASTSGWCCRWHPAPTAS
jgi:hypothetical protein